jgi:hypothetical protein
VRRRGPGMRRGAPCAPTANWVTDALFKGKEEKALEEFAKSEAGKRAMAHADEGGHGLDSIVAFGKKEVVESHVPGGGHLIDIGTRVLIATIINRVVRRKEKKKTALGFWLFSWFVC